MIEAGSLLQARPRTSTRALPALLLGAGVALAGCGSSDTLPAAPEPPAPAILQGLVVDGAGVPVERARVAVQFSPAPAAAAARAGDSPGDAAPLITRLEQNAPNPFYARTVFRLSHRWDEPVRLEILTRAGALVRTLVDDRLPPGTLQVAWDSRDAAGVLIANDVYVARFTAGAGDTAYVQEARVLLQAEEPAFFADAFTDYHGRFEIPLARFPVGETVLRTNDVGDTLGSYVISSRVVVCAAGGVQVGGVDACAPPLQLGARDRPVSVTVRLP